MHSKKAWTETSTWNERSQGENAVTESILETVFPPNSLLSRPLNVTVRGTGIISVINEQDEGGFVRSRTRVVPRPLAPYRVGGLFIFLES
ncbi:hypothetical protein AM501_16600 [Aneurinibacillus migulanus]|uniref:Uncharacterized protein n=1 Tax=Aneurinibacillus migulanus TaxID=47500 RepID=A0A0D1VK61_ANEMI|nr:hypothetical protein [Aneurinibacillus migulanus]KIV59934.1 hypothetical protein TS64_00290 [Aneurinibacillus migulanus]KIV60378.1 hypothetical protein TS65_00130 [Aneurinibacillus migulanus]KON94982.1 hypothetical protein AF333_05275 [Aneurinibacillus migulanus]KPD07134.1 hypothetical protein AM501_16600 [Aneurinibacillus migulanus]MED4729155.1 hypothetical protein [Aneurinibacillus migulanus]